MNNNKQRLSDAIDTGIRQAVAEAIERHRLLGQSIVVYKDGQIVTLTPDQIPPLNPRPLEQSSTIVATD